jgi:dipeptidyl aminopeptidase/acylaminoacyl peptidase
MADSRELEIVPSEFSLQHFSTMLLSGTGLTLEKVLADNGAYTRYSIYYYSNKTKVSGIMNIPKGEGPFPLLILNHGYIDPKVYTQGRGLKREQDYLARQGFAVLHTDYRGHGPSDPNPDPTDIADGAIGYSMDSANAILAVRAANLPRVDATKVGMLGHSMGGGVTMNVATSRPDLVDAVVLYAPVNGDAWQNFLRWRADSDEAARETLAALKTRAENESGWDAISYATKLADIEDPILLFHGTADKDVPLAWSDGLAGDLRTFGKDIEYITYPGEGHEFGARWPDFMRQTADFFRQTLAKR